MKLFYEKNKLEAGVDEVARGCLFGRVYSSAVIWDNSENEISCHSLIKDSKKLSKRQRLIMSDFIKENAIGFGISYVDEKKIDEINILNATYLCMHQAIKNINIDIEHLIIDGNRFKPYKNDKNEIIPHTCIISGDNNYYSIACASILAKIEHDKYIYDLCDTIPELNEKYGLLTNVGYGTKKHLEGIKKYGLTEFHRKTFGICKEF
jgi:ribonuclease HII